VAIGGGTGLAVLLRGLRPFAIPPEPGQPASVAVTALVTVTDDGGSSGRLRREFDVLPPGDIRNCLVALSEDEALMSRLFQYRFASGRGLKGHSFGNLFLTALTNITGDFAQAVRVSSEVLAIAGRIFPSTGANVMLGAELEDGSRVLGETKISKSRVPIRRVFLAPSQAAPLPESLEAIAAADLITLGPGSLYTSVIPNLLVQGVTQAILDSPASKAYVVNLMWQPGETTGYSAADHVEAIRRHSAAGIIDTVIVNTGRFEPALLRKYARQRAKPVEADIARLRRLGLKIVAGDLLEQSDKIRHRPDELARVVIELASRARRSRLARRSR
jgi:uncharacterized cofD-like protein